MPENPASFPRRALLTAVLAFGSLGALAAVTVPALPGLLHSVPRPLPDWATSTARTARAYRAALGSADLLAQLPCYCGCMVSPTLAHANLRDCYVSADGSLNPHAATCGICLEEALSATSWQAAGVSVVEIRQRIDDTYGGPSCTVDRCVE